MGDNATDVVSFLSNAFSSEKEVESAFDVEFALQQVKEIFADVAETDGQEEAEELLSWGNRCQQVKVVEAAIPSVVCPKGISQMILCDLKVFSKSRKPDDAIYDKSGTLRERVPRGLSVLRYKRGGDAEWRSRIIVHAFRKFTGGLEDNDDCNTDVENFNYGKDFEIYFRSPADTATYLVATQKINGEAAHFSAYAFENGDYVLCAGSKNVHLLFRTALDISLYKDSRYLWARSIATAFLKLLNTLEEQQRKKFIEFLVLSRLTGVFEILSRSHEHVEALGHLDDDQLWFLGWVRPPPYNNGLKSLLGMSPVEGYHVARAFGLSVTPYSVLPASKLQERIEHIHSRYGIEGEVLMFCTPQKDVIGLVKKKTVWYICIRAIREKVKGLTSRGGSANSNRGTSPSAKVRKRFTQIQSWLYLSDKETDFWKDLGEGMVRWTSKAMSKGVVTRDMVYDHFPKLWNDYLLEWNKSDRFSDL